MESGFLCLPLSLVQFCLLFFSWGGFFLVTLIYVYVYFQEKITKRKFLNDYLLNYCPCHDRKKYQHIPLLINSELSTCIMTPNSISLFKNATSCIFSDFIQQFPNPFFSSLRHIHILYFLELEKQHFQM